MSDEAGTWLRYAEENLRSARLLLEHGLLNPCLQNAQQAVEKALKATLIARAIPVRGTHSIQDLVRRFPEKNLPSQKVDAGLITMSYLGNCGSRFNRASTVSIATFPSAIPFVYTWRLSSTTG